MFKFLRKYNKWILAVGGTLLLIVFLIPQAIQGISQRAAVGAARRASVGNEEVTVREWSRVQEEMQFLDRIGASVPVLGKLRSPDHWYLLVREAEEAGLIGGPASVGITQTQLDQLSIGLSKSPSFILETQAKLSGVGRLLAMYQTAGKFSDRRLKQSAQRLFHAVATDLVVLEASADDSTLEPSEAELAAQLAAFADVEPGAGDMGFGYRLPNRVRIEWLGVDAANVRSTIEASGALSGVELRRHWRLNENTAGYPPIEAGAAVPDIVREGLLNELTAKRLDEIEQFAVRALMGPRRGLPMKNGYLELPDGWDAKRLAFPQLGEQIQAEFGIESPTYQSLGDRWFSAGETAEIELLGAAATTAFGALPVGLPQLISSLRAFDGSTSILTQAGVAGPPLRDADGGVYLYRVMEVDAARPPNSVDEVRDALVRDLKRKDSYERLRAQGDAIAVQARSGGLVTLALDHDTIVQPRTTVSRCNAQLALAQLNAGFQPTAIPTNLPVIGSDEKTVGAIVDRSLALGAATDLQTLSPTETIFTLPVEDKLCLLVVRLRNQVPLTQDTYVGLVNTGVLEQLLLQDEMNQGEDLLQAFSLEALSERHQFTSTSGGGDEDDADASLDGEVDPTS